MSQETIRIAIKAIKNCDNYLRHLNQNPIENQKTITRVLEDKASWERSIQLGKRWNNQNDGIKRCKDLEKIFLMIALVGLVNHA